MVKVHPVNIVTVGLTPKKGAHPGQGRRRGQEGHGSRDDECEQGRKTVTCGLGLFLRPPLVLERALARPDAEVAPYTHREPVSEKIGHAEDDDGLARQRTTDR